MNKKLVISLFIVLAFSIVIAPVLSSNGAVEIAYDDGERDEWTTGVVGYLHAVGFSLPVGWTDARLVTARYYLVGLGSKFKVHVYDSDRITDLVAPFSVTNDVDGDWFNVPLNVEVHGDFYIAIEYEEGWQPSIGIDGDAPIDEHSYNKPTSWPPGKWATNWNSDYMIRAVVEPMDPVSLLGDLKKEIGELPLNAFRFQRSANWQKSALCKQVDLVIRNVEAGKYECAIWKLKGLKIESRILVLDPWKAELLGKVDTIINMLQTM